MMRRIWLAAILGVVLGLGVAFIPNASTPAAPKVNILRPLVGETEATHTLTTSSTQSASTFELALLGLLAGVLVAAPFFFVARKRVQ